MRELCQAHACKRIKVDPDGIGIIKLRECEKCLPLCKVPYYIIRSEKEKNKSPRCV